MEKVNFTEEDLLSYVNEIHRRNIEDYKYVSQRSQDGFEEDVRKALLAVLKKYPDSDIALE